MTGLPSLIMVRDTPASTATITRGLESIRAQKVALPLPLRVIVAVNSKPRNGAIACDLA